jgi:multiple sugar transport system permease protein
MTTASQVLTDTRTSAAVRTRPSRGGWFIANLFMWGLLIYFIVPLVWLFLSATKSNTDLFQSFGFWFSHFNLLDNLHDLFTRDNGAYLDWMRNTIIYATTAAIGSTAISALAGYAFAMYRFRGRTALFAIILGSVFVPTTVLAVPLYFLLTSTGLANSLLAVILPALVNPFGVYLMRIFAERSVPEELVDAGRVDGAGEFRIFTTIALRLMAPGLVTVLLFAFVGAWNNYFLPLLVLGQPDTYPLTVGLANWNGLAAQPGEAQSVYALVVTGSAVAVLPIMIVFLLLQRYWQSGLALGSIRG